MYREIIPVPSLMWKLVVQESTGAYAAFIGVNDPRFRWPSRSICNPDHCASKRWLDFNVKDMDRGYIYCCNESELRKMVPHVPFVTRGAKEL